MAIVMAKCFDGVASKSKMREERGGLTSRKPNLESLKEASYPLACLGGMHQEVALKVLG